MCNEAGLRLHKFATNDEKVLQAIPKENRAEKTQHDIMPSCNSIERALGIQWCIKSDTFRYKIVLKDTTSYQTWHTVDSQLWLSTIRWVSWPRLHVCLGNRFCRRCVRTVTTGIPFQQLKSKYKIYSNNYINYFSLIKIKHNLKISEPDEWLMRPSLLNETSNIFETIFSQKINISKAKSRVFYPICLKITSNLR